MYKLIIEDDEGKKTIVPLIRDEITIGRKEGNTIRLTERNVSRRHARLTKHNGAVFLEDLESYTGIIVNGNKIDGRVAVSQGDRIQIGDYVLSLRIEGEPDARLDSTTAETHPKPTEELPLYAPLGDDASAGESAEGRAAHVAADQAAEAAPVEAEAAAAISAVARLVCVSSNFPGLECKLTKPVVVVGRTADNDVVVNHRSISRHHAQIIEDAGRYTIMDMQSANGVRVNGEEYGKVELRPGDLIDLGEVRMRFVGPHEKFDFATDATVFEVVRPEASRTGLWIGVGMVTVVLVGLVLWRVTRPVVRDHTTGDEPSAVATTNAGATEESAQAHDLVAGKIHSAVAARDWEQALALCDQLMSQHLAPDVRASASEGCKQARQGYADRIRLDQATGAATQNEHKRALELFQQIPDNSLYYRAMLEGSAYQQARLNFEAQQTRLVEQLVADGKCERAKVELAEFKRLLPGDTQLDQRVASCQKASSTAVASADAAEQQPTDGSARARAHGGKDRRLAAVRKSRRRALSKAGAGHQPNAGSPTPEQLASVKPTLDQAWKAYREGYYARASSLARQVLKIAPNQQALSIVGASACYLKRAAQAQSAYNRLDAQRRQLLRRVCERMGVQVH